MWIRSQKFRIAAAGSLALAGTAMIQLTPAASLLAGRIGPSLVGASVLALMAISWNLICGLDRISACLASAAAGDVNPRILNAADKEEVGRAGLRLNRLLDVLEVFLKESEASMAATAKRAYYRKIIPTGMTGIFGKAAIEISKVMDTMKARDEAFTHNLGGMADTFDSNISRFLGKLRESSGVLEKVASNLHQFAEHNFDQSERLLAAAGTSARGVSTVASTTEELSSSIREINTQLTHAGQVSAEAVGKSNDARGAIQQLEEGARKIGDIVRFIETIAQQTNLLALNATIEAARAGDAGKGFAVVAAEVKLLARKTSGATSEINGYISTLMSAVHITVQVIHDIMRLIDLGAGVD